jgi:PKHD-type hydroxylase
MIQHVNKYNAALEQFAVWRGGFTNDEVEQIKFLENLQEFTKGVVGSSADPKLDVRDSDIQWLHKDQNSYWVFDKMSQIIAQVNYDHFMFDIDGFEAFQYTKYAIGQHYDWHWDYEFGWKNFNRKISCVMMLNDPSDYEGGEFEICNNGNLNDIKKFKAGKGDIIFFSSWMPHRVLPVTSGERKSLVCWVMGKREC